MVYFQDSENIQWHIIEDKMGEDLSSLGFSMDAFERYRNSGLPEEALGNKASLAQTREALQQTSYDIVASALFSMWRYLTHWLEADPRDYFNFCIAALERLIILEESEQELDSDQQK